MIEMVYSAGSELRRPRHFLREAAADLRVAGPVGWRLFLHDVRARYRRAWLGYVWLFLPATATAFLCAFIRSQRLVTVGATDLPYALYVLSGIIFWQIFIEAVNAPLQRLSEARALITRTRLPPEGVFVAAVLELLLNAAARLAALFAALWLFGVTLSPSAALLPIGAAALILLGFALGVLIAPLGMLYDDVSRALLLGAAFLMFLTPVLYPIPHRGAFRLNPVTPLLETSRGWLTGAPASPGLLPVIAGSALILALAGLVMRVGRPHIVERLC